MLEEKIINYKEFCDKKVAIREKYRKLDLVSRYRIKRKLYSCKKLSNKRKDSIWNYLNGLSETLR